MNDPLRRRLQDAASPPSHTLNLGAIAARAARLDRRSRLARITTAGVAVLAVAAIGAAVIPGSSGRTTRVLSSATTATPAVLPSDQLVVIRDGGLQIIDAATGTVLRTVLRTVPTPTPPTPTPPTKALLAPIAVDAAGRTAFLNVVNVVLRPPDQPLGFFGQDPCGLGIFPLVAVDLQTGAQHQVAEAADAPAVSPDGTRLAYQPLTGPFCGGGASSSPIPTTAGPPSQVVVRNLRSGTEQSWQITKQLASLKWAPDGRRIVIGSSPEPYTGIQILDTGGPTGPDNPRIVVAPAGASLGSPGGRYADPAMRADGSIVALAPNCSASSKRVACVTHGGGVFVLDPSTGNVSQTILDDARDATGLNLRGLAMDPSGLRLAATSGTDLYDVSGGKPRLIAHNISAAAWLPRTAGVPTAPTTTTAPSTRTAPVFRLVPTVPAPTTAARGTNASSSDANQITGAIEVLFLPGHTSSEKLAVLDNPTGLDGVMAKGMADPRAPTLGLTVTNVVQTGPDSAQATITFTESGVVATAGLTLDFVKVNSRWRARTASWCSLISTGGLTCP